MCKTNENKLGPLFRFPEFKTFGTWEQKMLKQVSDIVSGQSPAGESYNKEGIGTPFYQGKTEFGDIFLKEPTKWTSEPTKFANADEIIMSVRAPVGALNISTQKICIGRGLAAIQTKENNWFLFYFLKRIQKNIIGNGGSVFDSINKDQIEKICILIPKPKEQQKIASCLSSLDDIITAESQKLEALKEHKKGLLQQLFPLPSATLRQRIQPGAERSRSPRLRFKEFEGSGEWEEKTIEQIAKVTTGNRDTQNKVDDGAYPFFVRSQNVERINSYSYDCEAILTSGDGVGVGKNFHYVNGKFDFHQRVYCIYDFVKEVSGKFVFMYFSQHFYDRVMRMSAKNSVDSVRKAMITDMPLLIPNKQEQEKIAQTISSLNDLITAQTQKIETLKLHKKGLLQGLFPEPIN